MRNRLLLEMKEIDKIKFVIAIDIIKSINYIWSLNLRKAFAKPQTRQYIVDPSQFTTKLSNHSFIISFLSYSEKEHLFLSYLIIIYTVLFVRNSSVCSIIL